jgi:molybdenum cofactor cytidylyltransferase
LPTVAAILLAAGKSERMGQPKPLLDWGSETLIEYQLRQLHDAGTEPVVVVLGHKAGEVRPAAERAGSSIVENEDYREGRASSVRRGASELTGNDVAAVLVLDVDRPRPAGMLRRLIDEHAASGSLISVPVHNGTRGHPPVFDASLLAELREVHDETMGLRAVVDRHGGEVQEVEFDSAVVLLEFNTPEEFEKARQAFEKVAP